MGLVALQGDTPEGAAGPLNVFDRMAIGVDGDVGFRANLSDTGSNTNNEGLWSSADGTVAILGSQAPDLPDGAVFTKLPLAGWAFTDSGEYRLRSETVLTAPVGKQVNLKVTLLDEYNSKPGGDAEKNDLRLTSGLSYSF